MGAVLGCLAVVVVSSSGATRRSSPIPSASPTAPIPGHDSVGSIGEFWTEVNIEYSEAKARHDNDRIIQLMSGLLLQKLSKEQVAITLTNRGVAYADKQELDKAMADFEQALRIDPYYALAYGARATLLARKGEFEKALQDFNEIIAMKPTLAKPYQTRGAVHAKLHHYEAARADFDKAIQLDPRSAGAYKMRGMVSVLEGETQKALDDAARAEAIDPATEGLAELRVQAYIRANRIDEARHQLDVLASEKSRQPARPLNDLAWIKATCADDRIRDGKEAVKAATQACELSHWKNAAVVDTLAASYAEIGDFESAVNYENQALELAPGEMQDRIPAMTDRLSLYRRHEPYREVPGRH